MQLLLFSLIVLYFSFESALFAFQEHAHLEVYFLVKVIPLWYK